jgi:hypothetical protein
MTESIPSLATYNKKGSPLNHEKSLSKGSFILRCYYLEEGLADNLDNENK